MIHARPNPLVIHFEREPVQGWHSIERVFDTVRTSLAASFDFRVVHCPTPAHTRFWLPVGMWRARRVRADLMHVVGDIHYVALTPSRTHTILTIQDLNCLDGLRGLRKIIFQWLYFTLPLRRSRAVTAPSEHTRNRLVALYPWAAAKIHVIPISAPHGFAPRPKAFSTREPRVLHIGTAANKNLERLAEALEGVPCQLQIVGRLTGEQQRNLRDRGIRFTNVVDASDQRMIELYEQADLVSFISLAEGFGMPIVEAQSVGRPVITSDLSPMKDVAGAGACLVDPYSVADIRRGLSRIVEDAPYRERLIGAGFENARRFSAERVAGQYAELYRTLSLPHTGAKQERMLP